VGGERADDVMVWDIRLNHDLAGGIVGREGHYLSQGMICALGSQKIRLMQSCIRGQDTDE
jgi:hypothetical protein